MANPDNLFARNIEFAGGLSYDLTRVHGPAVADTLNKISDNLMIDAQALSVCFRACAAFHEDEGKVLLANVPQRAKSIGEFTLLITTMGTGKSLIFSKIMETQQLKRQFDLKIDQGRTGLTGTTGNKGTNYRHAILNEITGPGLTRYLDVAGNIFVLIDEFDGDHQKLGMFGTETKSNNTNSSAASVLKSFHTGMPYYQKGKVSDSGYLKNPQVSFLAASNGAPVMDILRSKIKSSVMPDAMVMRTIFDVIDSPPKFNSNYRNKLLPPDAIGLELLLLASSLLCNQTYEFDTQGGRSADELLQGWQDMCVASSARWKNIDRWISSRFAKTSELTARLAAQLTHIDLTYGLLQEFIFEKQIQNPNGPVSFDNYCKMIEFFHNKFPPYSNTPIIISSSQVDAAIYTTEIILLKFFNLFDLTTDSSSPMNEIPWIPPSSSSYSNPAVEQIPATQVAVGKQIDTSVFDLCRNILGFPSICFTFTQIVTKYPKLKYRYKAIDPILSKLVEMELLSKIENGLRSGRNICHIYVKALPESITLNTVNSFVLKYLDPIKMPWTLYKTSCEKVILPSASAVLSQRVRQILNQENYLKIIQQYETSSSMSKKKQQEALEQASQSALDLFNNSIENAFPDSNASSSSEDFSQSDIQEKEVEQVQEHVPHFTSRSLPKSSKSTSSVVINSGPSQSSSPSSATSSSSQTSINYLLPRPPPQILRVSNNDNIIDPFFNELLLNSRTHGRRLSISNKESEPTLVPLTEMDEEIEADVRRSTRPRTKKRRIYSPEPIECETSATTKKKKTIRRKIIE